MSIVEKKKTELLISEPIQILVIPNVKDKVDEHDYLETELNRLKDVDDKNVKLALNLRTVNKKYKEMKNQYNKSIGTVITQLNMINRINFKMYCPELKKDIDFYQCCESCYHKFCKPLYGCNNRLEEIKKHFKT